MAEQVLQWMAHQGSWLDVVFIAILVVFAAVVTRLIVSTAFRIVVLFLFLAMMAGGLGVLRRVRHARAVQTWTWKGRGHVHSRVRKGPRGDCDVVLRARYRTIDLSAARKQPERRGETVAVPARCEATVHCGKQWRWHVGPGVPCRYFPKKQFVVFSCNQCGQGIDRFLVDTQRGRCTVQYQNDGKKSGIVLHMLRHDRSR